MCGRGVHLLGVLCFGRTFDARRERREKKRRSGARLSYKEVRVTTRKERRIDKGLERAKEEKKKGH
jgi:hypothetical protein